MASQAVRRRCGWFGWLMVIGVASVGGSGSASGAILTTGVVGSEPIAGSSRHRVCSFTLGHEPPGRTPELFAPELFSRSGHPLHGAVAIRPAEDRLCWSVPPPAIICTRSQHGHWTEPVDVHPFMDFPRTARFRSISPDGRFLFFWSEGEIWWVDSGVLPKRGAK